jgi:hypothetical protein
VWLTRGCAAVLEDQWDVQPTVKRIVAALQADGYDVWFDRKCCTTRTCGDPWLAADYLFSGDENKLTD